MTLKPPFVISSRLLPGLKIGDGMISIDIIGETSQGRTKYRYYIDTPNFEHMGDDLRSGCQGGSLQEGMECLLTFLGTAAEAHRYSMGGRTSENSDLFPGNVMEWAYQNDSAISTAQLELQTPNLIE